MADKRPLDDIELDALFSAARDDLPDPSAALIARVLADSAAQLPTPRAPAAAPRPGVMAAVLGIIGGWPAVAGLATAAVVGLAIGLATPDTLDDLTSGYLSAATGYTLDDLMPSYGDLLGEG